MITDIKHWFTSIETSWFKYRNNCTAQSDLKDNSNKYEPLLYIKSFSVKRMKVKIIDIRRSGMRANETTHNL